MKPYELVVLFHPDLEIDLDKPMKKVESVLKNHGGKIVDTDIWGKRKLAYKIGGEEFAVYVFYEVGLPPESVSKLEKNLNITDEVLRYLLTYPVPESESNEGDSKEEEQEEDSGSDKEDK